MGGGVIYPKIEVATGTGGDRVPMEQICGLHGGEFPANTIILSIDEQSNRQGSQEHICSSMWRYDTIGVMELYVLKAKLSRAEV